ncbi:amidohydrolase family protein [Azorhizobium doebereinerae]|uniref:amidohydrolase family protein n=1 Tax=Azorhizobium doebereinerae TaxID=281091 RepID=UPI000427B536|nr:amidohydrolase family protein [Azorhizobium doebereinerae]
MNTISRRACLAGLTAAAAGLPGLSALAQAQEKAQEKAAAPSSAPTILPPDPNTKTPDYKAPAGAVDTHTHIFGPNSKYPYAQTRSYTPPDAPLEMFRELHAKIGITRAVIVNATVHGRDNRVITDAIAQSNGAYKGIANVDETITDKELLALTEGGIKGCRFTFLGRLGGRPDMAKFNAVVDKIKGYGWHVDLYLEPEIIAEFVPILRQLPVPYVIDHMGTVKAAGGLEQKPFTALVELIRTDDKSWIKITGPERMSATGAPYLDTVPFAQALIAAAPERCLWGTDWPHPNVKTMPNDGVLVDLIPQFAPDPKQQQKLLVDNPVRLFGFAS